MCKQVQFCENSLHLFSRNEKYVTMLILANSYTCIFTFYEIISAECNLNASRVICYNSAGQCSCTSHSWNCPTAAEQTSFLGIRGLRAAQSSVHLTISYWRPCRKVFTRHPHCWWTETVDDSVLVQPWSGHCRQGHWSM